MSYLAGQQMTGVTQAAISRYPQALHLHGQLVIAGNRANTVKGARREEKEPGILYKEI